MQRSSVQSAHTAFLPFFFFGQHFFRHVIYILLMLNEAGVLLGRVGSEWAAENSGLHSTGFRLN
jgi:hypothetical protein